MLKLVKFGVSLKSGFHADHENIFENGETIVWLNDDENQLMALCMPLNSISSSHTVFAYSLIFFHLTESSLI